MSSPRSNPDNPADPKSVTSDEAAGARPPAEEGLFEETLRQTTHALVSRQPLTPAEKAAMADVAQRVRGKPLETVVSELILAVLKSHISGLPGFAELGPALSQRVARTLIDDPAAKVRLEALWLRLQGEAT